MRQFIILYETLRLGGFVELLDYFMDSFKLISTSLEINRK